MSKYKDKYKKLKECYDFNCQELNRVTMELVEAKCTLSRYKDEIARLEQKNNALLKVRSYIDGREEL